MTTFTFGRTDTGSTNGGLAGNYKWASKFTCNDTGQVTKISLYVTIDTGIWTGKAAIYSDNAGTPNALLGTSDAVTVNAAGWWDFPFSVPISVTSGSMYWLAVISGDSMSYGVSMAVSNFCFNADTYTDGFSDPFGAKTDVVYEACIYATGITGVAECVIDSDCVALHGPDWICVDGVCVYSPPPPEEYSLTVISAYGSPSPSVGSHDYDSGESVTCSVSSPVTVDDTVWTCTGWTGTGSVPSSGSGLSTTFSITQDSTITWNWVESEKGITIDGNSFFHIIDTLFSETNEVFEPEYLNQNDVTLDENVWNRGPLYVTYVMRLTSLERWVLDQILLAHALVNLTDSIYGLNNDVWIKDIRERWAGDVNFDKPWETEITVIVIPT